jgi:signal transduction histidine kinase
VESLLLLVQPEGVRPAPEVLDLEGWVSGHLLRWATHPRAADLRAEVADSDSLNVRVHPPLLAQLVDNLLENAFKYSAPGTPVVVKIWREEGSVMLGVEDRGCGLEAEDRSRVFEPFFRGEQARRAGHAGVGLGLAVAQQIAGAFGGSLEVRSQPEPGCFFVLHLPEVRSPVMEAISAAICDAHTG